jgi:hypothetical protein
MISDANMVDTLVARAARSGSLSTEELRQVVPVDAMSVDELASLIARLEDRGVTVDIDAALLSPTRRPSDQPRAAPDVLPPLEPPRPAPSVRPMARPAEPAPARPPERDTTAAPRRMSTSRPAQLGLTLVVILAVILALLVIGLVGLGYGF